MTREQLREFEFVRKAEAQNREYFELRTFRARSGDIENNEKLRNLKDGDKETIKAHYEYIQTPTRSMLTAVSSGPNSYLSFGNTHIKSEAIINVRREGNIIYYEGTITHKLNDPYDFKKFQPGADGALELQKHRGAKPYNIKSEWQQKFSGTVNIMNRKLFNPKIKWWDIEMEKSK